MSGGIVAHGVRRTFGDVVAVDHMDLTARPGEVTALVGPNGSGKTTLLLMLATLLRPDSGEIDVAGFDTVHEATAVREAMGWMPDVFGVYESLTAREVLRFAAAAYRIAPAAADARIDELLALVHLTEFTDRPVHVLSRGQKQRLGLARAVIHDPAVVILDEPAAGLDPRSRVELRDLLRRWAAEGRTVVVSSHVLAELDHTADRVVFVSRGRTVSEEAVSDLAREQHRPWRLRALDPPELLARLQAYGLDPQPSATDGCDVLLTSDEAAADLLARLLADGVRVVSSAPAGSTLETAYLAMTEERR